jgi:hypothetical protein
VLLNTTPLARPTSPSPSTTVHSTSLPDARGALILCSGALILCFGAHGLDIVLGSDACGLTLVLGILDSKEKRRKRRATRKSQPSSSLEWLKRWLDVVPVTGLTTLHTPGHCHCVSCGRRLWRGPNVPILCLNCVWSIGFHPGDWLLHWLSLYYLWLAQSSPLDITF